MRDLQTILKLRVPVIVRLGHRRMSLDDVLALGPGAIIELPQPADKPLDLMVNNKVIANGGAVKVGENFGLRIQSIGDPHERVHAMAAAPGKRRPAGADMAESDDEPDPAQTPEPPAPTDAS